MEAKGVIFNVHKEYKGIESFTVTISGDQDQYIRTIKSLLSLMMNVKDDMRDPDDIFDICSLITDMLPTPEQITMIHQDNKTSES
jgi:hypothetical protein